MNTPLPVIHLNGTSRETLVSEYQAALDAVREARAALARVTVNGRDYYPIGPNALDAAIAEHRRHQRALHDVAEHLGKVLWHLTDLEAAR